MWRVLTASALALALFVGPASANLDFTQVSKIFLRIHTANEGNAETKARIMLGFGGREILLDDNGRGRNDVTLDRVGGPKPTVPNGRDNDPAVGPRILVRDIHNDQVYLRLPDGETDHWIVHEVDVQFTPAVNDQTVAHYCFVGRAILGPTTGMKLPLKRIEDPLECR